MTKIIYQRGWFKFTVGDLKTVFLSPSKLALGIFITALTSYATEAISINWDIIGILCVIPYLGGIIVFVDNFGTEGQV